MKELVVVLGMHRSGTSAITGVISDMGYSPGKKVIEADSFNEKGYFENSDIVALNKEILDCFNMSWNSIDDLHINRFENLYDLYAPYFYDRAVELINNLVEEHTQIVLKDPSMCITLPFWKKVFNNFNNIKIKYVYIFRDPIEVAQSLLKKSNLEGKYTLQLWIYYNCLILNNIDDSFIGINFKKLINSTDDEINRLSRFLLDNNLTTNEKKMIEERLKHNNNDYESSDLNIVILNFIKLLENFSDDKITFDILIQEYIKIKEKLYSQLKNVNKIYHDDMFQIFISNNDMFKEENSKKIFLNSNRVELTLDLEECGNISDVRIDPSNLPAVIKINEIVLQNDNNTLHIENYYTNSSLSFGDLYIFRNLDPQIHFKVKQDMYKKIKINYELYNIDHSINYFIKNNAILKLKEKNKKFSEVIDDRELLITKKDNELNQKDELVKSQKNVIKLKNKQLLEKDTYLEQKIDKLHKFETLVNQQSNHLKKLEQNINEKEKIINIKETELYQINVDLGQKNNKIKEFKELINQKSQNINELEKNIAEKEQVVNFKNEELFEKNINLEKKDNEIQELVVKNNDLMKEIIDTKDDYCLYKFKLTKKSGLLAYYKEWKDCYLIFKSKKFDSQYYEAIYPDVREAYSKSKYYHLSLSQNRIISKLAKCFIHPIRHYVKFGQYEGRNPNSFFDTNYYLKANSDVLESGFNPFLHFILYGKKEGRAARASLLDGLGYIEKKVYRKQIEIIKNSKLFNRNYYLSTYIDVKNANIDPVEHYCFFGWKEGRNPSKEFNTNYYLADNEDVKVSNLNPLYHYIVFGEREGRKIASAKKAIKGEKTIVFISHSAEQTGAPIILLDIIKWFNEYTEYSTKVILLKGGKIINNYINTTDTIVIDEMISMEENRDTIYSFIGKGEVLFFINTVISVKIINYFDISKYPSITFIHELEKSLNLFPKETKEMEKHLKTLICASDAVTKNLIDNHGYNHGQASTIYAFINPQNQSLNPDQKRERRNELNLPIEGNIIFGCGVAYWIKNPKGFVEIANNVIKSTKQKCYFIWIGDGEEVSACEKIVKNYGLNDKILFIGSKDNPRDYFACGDVFMLPSIEDSFPLVCLEAADCSLPIVCFDEAGGMPRFVEEDAGIIVPYNDNVAMSNAVVKLIEDDRLRIKLGYRGNEKLNERHVINKSTQQIKKIIDEKMNKPPLVSVIVPNYNHSKYLIERLETIYNQTFKDIEVILMDDCSTDNSRKILDKYANKYMEITTQLYNEENSGSVFKQWRKGMQHARGKYIWIAESDDYCDDNFLETVLPTLMQEDIVLSYCNSNIVGSERQHYGTYDDSHWLVNLNPEKWTKNYINSGKKEFLEALAIKCTIPNASAVVFEKNLGLKVIKKSFDYTKAGDWIFYTNMTKYGNFAYHKNPLNYHRRHEQSVTSKEGDELGVIEVFNAHKYFTENFFVPSVMRNKMYSFIKNEYNIYKNRKSIGKNLDELYDKEVIHSIPQKLSIILYQHGLNFGKGGAEKMLIYKANLLYERGYDVNIINRTYSDNPLPYKLNSNVQIHNVGVEENMENLIKEINPNIAIVFGIGHPDKRNIDQFHGADVPVILSMHNHPPFFDKTPGKKDHMESLGFADRIVVLIPSFKDDYIKRGIKTQVSVIPNFVEQPEYVDTVLNNGRKFIFNAGRLAEQKQQHLLIEAFSKIADKHHDIDLLIAGEGYLRLDLENQIKELNMQGRIILLGEINNIGDYYNACEIFAFSSKFEGFGLTIFEAASFGKPVIVFKDCPPYGEIIHENSGVLLIEEMNSEALAKGISKTLESNYKELSKKMIDFYKQYSPDNIIPMWEEIIKRTVESKEK